MIIKEKDILGYSKHKCIRCEHLELFHDKNRMDMFFLWCKRKDIPLKNNSLFTPQTCLSFIEMKIVTNRYRQYQKGVADLSRGENMKINKRESIFLNAKNPEDVNMVQSNKNKAVINSEFEEQEQEFEDKNGKIKTTIRVTGKVLIGKKEKVLSISNPNDLIDTFGDDTKKWIGKTIKLSVIGEGNYKRFAVVALE